MDKFLKEYNGKALEDAIMENSEDVKSFNRKFKNYLKRALPDYEILKYNLGHYYISGFFKKDDVYVYFSYNIPRYGQKIDVNDEHWGRNAVLIRVARDENDFHGEQNHYCSLAGIATAVPRLSREAALRKCG